MNNKPNKAGNCTAEMNDGEWTISELTVVFEAVRRDGGPASECGARDDALAAQRVSWITAVLQHCAYGEGAAVGLGEVYSAMQHRWGPGAACRSTRRRGNESPPYTTPHIRHGRTRQVYISLSILHITTLTFDITSVQNNMKRNIIKRKNPVSEGVRNKRTLFLLVIFHHHHHRRRVRSLGRYGVSDNSLSYRRWRGWSSSCSNEIVVKFQRQRHLQYRSTRMRWPIRAQTDKQTNK